MQIPAERLIDLLPWPKLIEALKQQFREGCEVPDRHHHAMHVPGEVDATMLLMPAWQPGSRIGVKIVNVFPSNAQLKLPSITADYLLYDGKTGQALATMDGATITSRRTAAAAALGAAYLSRKDSETLFLVGTGRVAALIPDAMRAVRPIKRVLVWNRSKDGAIELCKKLNAAGYDAQPEFDLKAGTEAADIISCATLSKDPLIQGAWLKPGQHLDLIGSFTPEMRETDDEAMQVCDVYIDTDTAFTESGDIVAPIASGTITRSDIKGNLTDLCRGDTEPRNRDDAITLFKAVGTALEDLAAASLAYDEALETQAG